jgi:ABC-type sugar transport system ATPase subunit
LTKRPSAPSALTRDSTGVGSRIGNARGSQSIEEGLLNDIALSMVGISKSFGPVAVLNDVNLELRAGEVHALLGENGAGKSSLMKILMGVHQPDRGQLVVGGRVVRFANPADAQRNRVSMVYQEFGLVPTLSVTENIFLGRLPMRFGRIDWPRARAEATALLARIGSRVRCEAIVGTLKVADQQEVEIARALSYDPLVFIMDEPSSALSRVEVDNLYGLVRVLKKSGIAIVYITHKLDEVFALANQVTILRDGKVAGTFAIRELDMKTLVESMTGKPVSADAIRESAEASNVGNVIELEEFAAERMFSAVNFAVGRGRVVGVAGVIGAGKSELARAIVGALPDDTDIRGKIIFQGAAVDPKTMTPNKARRLGIGFVSEDRQAEGIVQGHSVQFNIVLPALNRVSAGFLTAVGAARQLALSIMDVVGLRPREPTKLIGLLSGGNQQKVVIGKWLAAQSKFLILDEPTRGIDVNARQEIYGVIRREARERGLGVLLLSSDMREILVASDRILVMVQGRITREVAPHEVTEHQLLEMIMPAGVRSEKPVSDVLAEAQ